MTSFSSVPPIFPFVVPVHYCVCVLCLTFLNGLFWLGLAIVKGLIRIVKEGGLRMFLAAFDIELLFEIINEAQLIEL